ncbi:hypothetical protein RIF29_16323 [Crotalaria pallida]|uniref:Uncharacterized protein n=1 Tax=Crotalaria pallida TaxID=3830 RepID=A0AAN9IEC7_CROPI
MLVQDRSIPKSPKPFSKSKHNLHPIQTSNFDFPKWVSENLCKIVTFFLLVATVAALFFLRSIGDSAALFCFRNQAKIIEKIELPRVYWSSIEPIADKTSKGDVIGGELGKHFDLELNGEGARKEVILQYSHDNPNRTVVNSYVHFGLRSVWPKGLPLENVGEIGHEEFYTEVFGGKQFIQQGISNGLPDVDSVFYFTRKSSSEAFDVRFDELAPKVALPQGLMVPVNSFNTLFHSSTFWALMLPVSVSTMASDVLRGYWGQRLIWEVGGYVVVYPPTVYRYDKVEAYPFSEEKDLHVNVSRLIKYLVSWRSSKHGLFEKVLDLSYEMVEEGFWTEMDLKFTAAWLQDLIAVGYKQPRLMSLELGCPRENIGHGDRREFIPQKLSSIHLGVEEAGAVNYEIGNLIRWRKTFGNVVLILHCSGPVERTALKWRLLYGRIFKTVVILSEKKDLGLSVEESYLEQAYKYPNHGVLYPNPKTVGFHGKQACSEVFYVPQPFTDDFVELVNLIGNLEIHQKVAIPMIFISIDSPKNFDSVLDKMIYKRKVPTNSSTHYSAKVPALHPWNVASEQEFIKLIRIMAEGDPLLMELV